MPEYNLARGRFGGGRYSVDVVYLPNGTVTTLAIINTCGVPIAGTLVESNNSDRPTGRRWAFEVAADASEIVRTRIIDAPASRSREPSKPGAIGTTRRRNYHLDNFRVPA